MSSQISARSAEASAAPRKLSTVRVRLLAVPSRPTTLLITPRFSAGLALTISIWAISVTLPTTGISEAQGINDSGGIIGVSAAPPLRAALFGGTGSGNIDLGALNDSPLDSAAYAINNAGEIVGFAEGAGNGHATLFSGTGSNNIDLGTLGGATSTAYAVNNSSQIVGKAATAQQAD